MAWCLQEPVATAAGFQFCLLERRLSRHGHRYGTGAVGEAARGASPGLRRLLYLPGSTAAGAFAPGRGPQTGIRAGDGWATSECAGSHPGVEHALAMGRARGGLGR